MIGEKSPGIKNFEWFCATMAISKYVSYLNKAATFKNS